MSSCEGPPGMNRTMLCLAFGGKVRRGSLRGRRARLLIRQQAIERDRPKASAHGADHCRVARLAGSWPKDHLIGAEQCVGIVRHRAGGKILGGEGELVLAGIARQHLVVQGTNLGVDIRLFGDACRPARRPGRA